MKIGIIGCGVMGEIIAGALVKKAIVEKSQLIVSNRSKEKCDRIAHSLGIQVTENNNEVVDFVDLLIICIKPQNAPELLSELRGKLNEHQFVISIMAGIRIETLQKELMHTKIIRSMPNLTARITEGMTVWMASPEIENFQKMIAKMIFQSFGKEIEVHTEDLLNSATAISGTGPAYIYYFAEHLMKAALDLGFNNKDVHKLVQQTFKGAMDLWNESNEEPETLRLKVTSKGGTTEAATKFLNEQNVGKLFQEGVKAAYKRSKELGK